MKRDKKSAAIISGFDPYSYKGGIETFLLNLKTLLMERDISVDIHFVSPSPTMKVKPFTVKSLEKKIPEFLQDCFMLGRALSKIQEDYDFIISNNFYGLGYFAPKVKSFNIYHSTHVGYANALRGKVPQAYYRELKYLYGYVGDGLGGRGKGRIAVSQSIKDELRRYYGFRKVNVVNHGIDTEFYKKLKETTALRKKWDIHADAFVGIFVGRWEIGKGTDIMEDVIRAHPDIVWLLAIGPSQCPLRGIGNVRIVEDADKETLRELYSASDFMLLPSYYEGFGLTVIEAMACALPVICTKVGVANDLFLSDTLRKLGLERCGKDEMVKEIGCRISFLRKTADKDRITALGRSIIEREYPLDVWKSKMLTALGLSH
ncbi:MAG TPA: glycosyltransferase family 4 protein [Thermodesulfovibrionales bacterium]|nr:glycosyltransferase family 4 protein [Thermodesulfovibrionales bacterium]